MFDEFGSESFAPSEDGGQASEGLSEAAKARFAGQAAGAAQVRAQAQKAKKRDDSVANAIIAFLTDKQKQHLATLIARIVERDCPSPFLLAILSLINPTCLKTYDEYARENQAPTSDETMPALQLPHLSQERATELAEWTIRVSQALAMDPERIIRSLLQDDQNFDPTLLQLMTFVMEEFLHMHAKDAPYEKLQPVAAMILQSLFEPHMGNLELTQIESEESEEDTIRE